VYPAHVDFQFAERDVEGDFHLTSRKSSRLINTLAEKLPDPLVDVLGRAVACASVLPLPLGLFGDAEDRRRGARPDR